MTPRRHFAILHDNMEKLEKQFFAKKAGDGEEKREAHEDVLSAPIADRKKELQKEVLPLPIEADEKEGKVFVLQTELPVASEHWEAGSLVPRPEDFRHFTLDQRTLETIEKIATAVELKEPCLLEGETSTSKTSSIEYLAMRTRNQVIRMNLNGQTDTSELIGKFVPNDGQLYIAFKQLLAHPELLAEQSRAILQRADSEGRGLTLIESEKIAQAENMKVPDWRWQNGIIPDAMINGYWVILDEVNLGEPQVLERINPVLERNPSLTLSENEGMKIGAGGENSVHQHFRIFATMNPAEYSGRQPMSPAYKDRWTSYKFVEAPSDEDYAAMMELMVYGEQPKVEIKGKKYRGEKTDPMFSVLQEIPNFRGFIGKMAKFQTTIEDLARRRVIGKDKKEQYIFTRRGLIEFLDYLEYKKVIDRATRARSSIKEDPKEIILRAIQYHYLDKIKGASSDDLKKVEDQLDAIGISEENWTHKFEDFQEKEESREEEEESREEENKEKKEGEGRDPEKFFKEVFDWISKNSDWKPKDSWSWGISKDDSLVDMYMSNVDKIPPEYIDKAMASIDFTQGRSGTGISSLLEQLTDKKIISVAAKKDNKWYLEIVSADGEKVVAEKSKETEEGEEFKVGEEVLISETSSEFSTHKGEKGVIEDITDEGLKIKVGSCIHVFSRKNIIKKKEGEKIDEEKDEADESSEKEIEEKEKREYKTAAGEMYIFDVSRKACEPFGFYPGDRVRTSGKQMATVIGVCDNKLWFHIDGGNGASYWGESRKEDFKRRGFELVKKAEK